LVQAFAQATSTSKKLRPRELSVLIHPGQMLIVRPDATSLPDPANVDLKRILKTSLLITDFPPLPSEALMYQEAQNQSDAKAKGQFVDTNLVIFGGETVVSLVDPTSVNVISQGTAAIATPTPIPSKFGPPSAITSPNPLRHNQWHADQYRSHDHNEWRNRFRENLSRGRSRRSVAHLAW
jgi:hypothetical protein